MRKLYQANWLFFALFFLIFLFNIFTTYQVTQTTLDSDQASELVLAKHLSETHQILSKDWYYSTELRVLDGQIINSFLFRFFYDWHMVRFIGTVLLQFLLIFSFCFLMRSISLNWSGIWIGASLMLIPYSIAYGRLVLYHAGYIPHIVHSFFIVGLFIRCIRNSDHRIVKTILVAILSFCISLNGIRQPMITFVPLMMDLLVLLLLRIAQNSGGLRPVIHSKEWIATLTGFLGCVCAAAAFLVNSRILTGIYSFDNYFIRKLGVFQTSVGPMLEGFLVDVGYRSGIALFSILGLAGLAGGVFGICVTVGSFHEIWNMDIMDQPFERRFIQLFYPMSLTVLLVTMLIGGQWDVCYEQYFTLSVIWIIPYMICILEEWIIEEPLSKECTASRTVSAVFCILMILCLAGNGFINGLYYLRVQGFEQPYLGLSMSDRDYVQEISPAADFLRQKGYKLGYADFWDCNIVTEITDGQVQMIDLLFYYDEPNMPVYYYNWLTQKNLRNQEMEETFFLIPEEDCASFCMLTIAQKAERIYQDPCYSIFLIRNPEDVHSFLRPLGDPEGNGKR